MNMHQGEDIDFGIRFDSSLSQDIQSFDDLDEFIVYVYTNVHRPVMFSSLERDGYIQLVNADSLNYAGVIPAAVTKTMQVGDVYLNVMMVKDGIRAVDVIYQSGVHLDPAKIKMEA